MNQPQLIAQHYQVIKQLGSGGFGDTFLAQDLHSPSQKLCVVKQLRRIDDNPQTYQLVQNRFNREALILEQLGRDYNYIPALYAYFEENGFFYLVQEYIEGITLSEFIEQKGPQSEDFTLNVLRQVLEILQYVHGQKIIHRDIKPDNIILRHTDQSVVLIDFGAIKEVVHTRISQAGNLKSSIVIGTPGFMSPEQGIGRPSFGSDLYSLGLVAIYVLTGKLPDEFQVDITTGELDWEDQAIHVNSELRGLLSQAISSHPRDRFKDAQAMIAALGNIVPSPSTSLASGQTQQRTVLSPPSQPTPTVTLNPPPSTTSTNYLVTTHRSSLPGYAKVLGLLGFLGIAWFSRGLLFNLPQVLLGNSEGSGTSPVEEVISEEDSHDSSNLAAVLGEASQKAQAYLTQEAEATTLEELQTLEKNWQALFDSLEPFAEEPEVQDFLQTYQGDYDALVARIDREQTALETLATVTDTTQPIVDKDVEAINSLATLEQDKKILDSSVEKLRNVPSDTFASSQTTQVQQVYTATQEKYERRITALSTSKPKPAPQPTPQVTPEAPQVVRTPTPAPKPKPAPVYTPPPKPTQPAPTPAPSNEPLWDSQSPPSNNGEPLW